MASSGGGAAAHATYEEILPAIAWRLNAALRKRGVAPSLRDDVIQETATRLWERWAQVDAQVDVFPLALTIARNLVIDQVRQESKVELRALVGEGVAEDPFEVTSMRLELKRVLQALMSLTPRYRDLLLAEVGWTGETSSEHGGVAANMARMRARRRLRGIMERAGAILTLPLRRIRAQASKYARMNLNQEMWLGTVEVAVFCVLTLLVASDVVPGVARDTPSPHHLPYTAPQSDRVGSRPPSRESRLDPSLSSPYRRTRGNEDLRPVEHRPVTPSLSLSGLPRSKSKGESRGSFGLWGIEETGQGNLDANGEKIHWKYQHSYRTPRCVRRAANGEISTDCSGGEAPRGYVEIEHEGRSTRIDYGD